MKKIIIIAFLFCAFGLQAQVVNTDSTTNEPLNSVNNIIKGNSSKGITLGAYAQIDYNQEVGEDTYHKGKMDVHRLVLFLGYKFNEKTTFVTEIELEHVEEVYVEQAFLNYQIDPRLNFRAGLLLIPMGIINEYHEPTTYNGVERPNLDSKIVPTTWREIGAGFSGNFSNASLKYQVYVVNGFDGFSDGGGNFKGESGLRSGRQKGAESFISSPNLSTKVDYYGIQGLKLGLAGYFGKSQTDMYDGLSKSDDPSITIADSSVVNISMIGLDARYQNRGFQARGQFTTANIGNTAEYNAYTGKDLGSKISGYYIEAGYDILRVLKPNADKQLTLFARYEGYNTHADTNGELVANKAYDRTDITIGAGLKLSPGAVLKADYQIMKNEVANSTDKKVINLGVGIWF